MADELRFHLEQCAEDLMRAGVAKEEAYRRARLEMGGMNSVKEDCRQARGLRPFDEVGRNVRFAVRLLRKSPTFTMTALLTLALCLGANLTIYAVIDAILVRPLPFPHSEQLVTIFNSYPKAGVDRDGSSFTNYYERRGKIASFRAISMYGFGTAIVGGPGSTAEEEITWIEPNFFSTLDMPLAMGREFTDTEMSERSDRVAILTDGYWRDHFAGDARVIGRELLVNGFRRTVVGVLPAGFHFLSSKLGSTCLSLRA